MACSQGIRHRLNTNACPHHRVSQILPHITQAWTSLFRPQTLDALCGHAHLKRIIHMHVNQLLPPPCMLWHGPPGTGKTSMARALVAQYGQRESLGDHVNTSSGEHHTLSPSISTPPPPPTLQKPIVHVVEMNASERRNYSDVMSVIGDRINTLTHVTEATLQFFIVDECEAMTVPAQVALAKLVTHIQHYNQDPQGRAKIGLVAMCNDLTRVHWRLQSALFTLKFDLVNVAACHTWLVSKLRNLLCRDCWPSCSPVSSTSTGRATSTTTHSRDHAWQLHLWTDIDLDVFTKWVQKLDAGVSSTQVAEPVLDMRHMLACAQAHVQSLAVTYIEAQTRTLATKTQFASAPTSASASASDSAPSDAQPDAICLMSTLNDALVARAPFGTIRSLVQDLHRVGVDNIQLAQRLLQSPQHLTLTTRLDIGNKLGRKEHMADNNKSATETPAETVLHFLTRTQSLAVVPDIYIFHLMFALYPPPLTTLTTSLPPTSNLTIKANNSHHHPTTFL